jgi:hypothetical protein
MANTNTQPVQGFKVQAFMVKKDEVKLTLVASKDEVRAGTYDLGDVLKLLELHSSSDFPIELTLVTTEPDQA